MDTIDQQTEARNSARMLVYIMTGAGAFWTALIGGAALIIF